MHNYTSAFYSSSLALQPNASHRLHNGPPPYPSLEATFSGFLTGSFFYRVGLRTPRQPSTWRTSSLEIGWPSYTPRHWVPILVVFYDMRGLQWDYSLISVTTRDLGQLQTLSCEFCENPTPITRRT